MPYKTEWVEFPDIEAVCKKAGGAPTETKPDGTPYYTLPMIYDPTTQTVITGSTEIVKYLDTTYPNTPQLFPGGSYALQIAGADIIWGACGEALFMNIVARLNGALSERSQEYFRRTREAELGAVLEKIGGDEYWKSMEDGLGKVQNWLDANGKGKNELFGGDKICYADIQLASILIWARVICGEESDDWKRIAEWHSGRWGRYLEFFDKYASVDA